jgi:hypothetical protein
MNLTSISTKSKLIIIGVAVLLVFVFALLLISTRNPQKTTPPTQTPTQTTFPTPALKSNFIVPPTTPPASQQQSIDQKKKAILEKATSNNNGDVMLLESPNFNVKYVTSADVFFVTLYKEPVEDFKNSASKWFLDQDLSQNDLCLLNVRFRLATDELARSNPNFSSLPTGC